jgi:hypothetical protein
VIDANNNPVAGVTVSAGSITATTDNRGIYALVHIPAGTYTVTATLPGYTFPSLNNLVVGTSTNGFNGVGNVWGANFKASVAVAVSISPASISIPVNTTKQFAATVSGTTNTDVTWSCTGGTISQTGLYTAPGTAGTYTVKATSKADTTKSASAAVTVVDTYNEVESNGSISTANAAPDNVSKVVGYIGTSTDNDYFKVRVNAGRTLTVNMTGPSTKDYDLYLSNGSAQLLAKSDGPTSTETLSYTNSGSTAVDYYIRVKGYRYAYSTGTPYNLVLSR